MALTPKAYEKMKKELDGYAERYGPAAVMIALLDFCGERGMAKEGTIIEGACIDLGVKFQQKIVPSETTGEEYTITQAPDGKMTCSCKGFIFSKVPNRYYDDKKWCKHLERYGASKVGWQSVKTVDFGQLPMPQMTAAATVVPTAKRMFRAL